MILLVAGVLSVIAGIWLMIGTGSVVGPLFLVGVSAVLLIVDTVRSFRRHHQRESEDG